MNEKDIQELLRKANESDVWRSYLLETLAKLEDPSKYLSILIQKGYFNPDQNPKPIEDAQGYTMPYWESLGYLTQVSKFNKSNPNEKTTKGIKAIIDSIIDYHDDQGNRIENTKTDYFLTKMIFDLPINEISQEYVGFVRKTLRTKESQILVSHELSEKILPMLIKSKSKELLCKLLEIVFDFEINEKAYFNKFSSIIGDYYLAQISKKYQSDLIEICGSDLSSILANKIEEMLSKDEGSFNSVITIEDSSQNLGNKYQTIMLSLYRDSLLQKPIKDLKLDIITLLGSEFQILRRLAIYLIDVHYDTFSEIFWSFDGNPLEDYMLKHELYELFRKHCKSFTKTQLSLVSKWIETENLDSLKNFYKDPKEREIGLAYHKKEWLTSLLETKDDRIEKLYSDYSKIATKEIEHPGFLVWTSGVVVSKLPTIPIDEELEGKTNEFIADFLKTYKEEPKKGEVELSRSTLSRSFEKYVKQNPEKISANLTPFRTLSCELQHSLLEGLNNALQSEGKIDWKETLNFCYTIVEPRSFWSREEEHRDWIVKKIAEIIHNGTKSDKNAFDPEYLPLAEKIMILLGSRDNSKLPSIMNLFTSVINSTKGSIYKAMISYSRRYAEVRKERVWKEPMRRYFDNELDQADPPIELFVTIGTYLPTINYLDNNWVKENIDRIFPKEKEKLWKATVTGYSYGSNRLYRDIYDILKNSNNYTRAITTKFEDGLVTRRLVEHACVAYLFDLEDIDDEESLLNILIKESEPHNISILINFIRRTGEEIYKNKKEKIIALWEKLVNELTSELEFSEILSSLVNWIKIIDTLDSRTTQLLKISAKSVSSGLHLFTLVESLLKFVEEKPKEVGEILNEAIKADTILYHKEESIQKIVKTLYEKGEKSIADAICEKLWNKKQFFLKDIYDMYNK